MNKLIISLVISLCVCNLYAMKGFGLRSIAYDDKPKMVDSDLCFTAAEANSRIKLEKTGSPDSIGLEYKLSNDSNWHTYTIGSEITLADVGSSVSFRSDSDGNDTFSKSLYDYYHFVMSGSIEASGNIQSLIHTNRTAVSLSFSRSGIPEYYFANLFVDCTSLITPPLLPAQKVEAGGYHSMFWGCSSLIKAPNLPASSISTNSYYSMFYGCANMQYPPEQLPAKNLAPYCYCSMFYGCSSMIRSPKIDAITMSEYSCCYMFVNCARLKTSPSINATTLAPYCCSYMFAGSAIESCPTLYTDCLEEGCYEAMFMSCANLTGSAHINAIFTAANCFDLMFYDSTGLTDVYMLNMVQRHYDPSYTGSFGEHEITVHLMPDPPDYDSENYLCFYVTEDNRSSSVSFSYCSLYAPTLDIWLEYATNFSQGWKPIALRTIKDSTTIRLFKNGDKVWVRRPLDKGYIDGVSAKSWIGGKDLDLSTTGRLYSKGNVHSLIDGTMQHKYETLRYAAFYLFFSSCEGLVTAPELPHVDTISRYCYGEMFSDCTNLISAPLHFDATNVQDYGYSYMFKGCTRLSGTPVIDASQISTGSLQEMFGGNSKITDIYIPNMKSSDYDKDLHGYPWSSPATGTIHFKDSAD